MLTWLVGWLVGWGVFNTWCELIANSFIKRKEQIRSWRIIGLIFGNRRKSWMRIENGDGGCGGCGGCGAGRGALSAISITNPGGCAFTSTRGDVDVDANADLDLDANADADRHQHHQHHQHHSTSNSS
ncbi:hypothetical protein M0802_008949 [Mischocyttarus mexicanus]|nr:hypothetical protein M0802_008949 [Mischocyttarus mexicanus]